MLYIGGNKFFASVSSKPLPEDRDSQWSDDNLQFAIVDLAAQKIIRIAPPAFTGDGGRSFVAFNKEGKAYATLFGNL